jgi:hypothetical protein
MSGKLNKEDIMSNTNSQPADQSMPEWYDPYPEPNTMPRKWDLSQYGYPQSEAPKQPPVDKKDTQPA